MIWVSKQPLERLTKPSRLGREALSEQRLAIGGGSTSAVRAGDTLWGSITGSGLDGLPGWDHR
jgi:hypothetical protein